MPQSVDTIIIVTTYVCMYVYVCVSSEEVSRPARPRDIPRRSGMRLPFGESIVMLLYWGVVGEAIDDVRLEMM
jgi:hypothetical protein